MTPALRTVLVRSLPHLLLLPLAHQFRSQSRQSADRLRQNEPKVFSYSALHSTTLLAASAVQLAWQEWTNGGQHTIADRVRQIKADSALGIGRRNSTLHKKNRHLPQLIEYLIKLGASPDTAVSSLTQIADCWQLSLGQMRQAARLINSKTAKGDDDALTPETNMTLGQFKQAVTQIFDLLLADRLQ